MNDRRRCSFPHIGDWQPRNWLVDGCRVLVIDLGRADWRPALTDLARLSRQQWNGRSDLEAAFLAGYGADPHVGAALGTRMNPRGDIRHQDAGAASRSQG